MKNKIIRSAFNKYEKIELRIEKVHDQEDNNQFYFIYAYVNRKVKLIGRSKTFPQIYKFNSFIKGE
jgi:hypothetical protein